jgi:multiple antibiotic resistance protein
MYNLFRPFLLTFIPIFVAVDAIGNIPLFISLAEGLSKKQRHTIINRSVATATVMAVLFMFIGKGILRVLNITISDFQVAGGLLLFIIASRLLLPGAQKIVIHEGHNSDIGVFPLGTPLITGPAVLTTTLIMLDSFGTWPTFVSLVLNMSFVWLTLTKSEFIMKLIGSSGTRAFSKVMYILLAGIAIMMIRRGLEGFIRI